MATKFNENKTSELIIAERKTKIKRILCSGNFWYCIVCVLTFGLLWALKFAFIKAIKEAKEK